MSQAAKASEPSMEEILASIRRIIADDEVKPPPAEVAKAAEAARAAEAAPAPVRENPPALREVPLKAIEPAPRPEESATPEQVADAPEEPRVVTIHPAPHAEEPAEPEIDETALAAAIAAMSEAPPYEESHFEPRREPAFTDYAPARSYASNAYEAPASERAPQTAANTLLSNQASEAVTTAFSSLAHTVFTQNAQTLDDLVREMLRPMLKSWLDDNLPTVVERLVRAEIERVSRGR